MTTFDQPILTQTNTKTMTNKQPIIVGLDIGTTKIAAIAGRKMNSANSKSWDSAALTVMA